jgi:RecB family endonuclease NucS
VNSEGNFTTWFSSLVTVRGERLVLELKPNTPSAVSSGSRQLRRYVNHMEQQSGGGWLGILVVY